MGNSIQTKFNKVTKCFYLLFLCISCVPFFAVAQTLSVKQLLQAWKISDTSQTRRAEETYADLRQNYDTIALVSRVEALEKYLKKNPDRRLGARIMLYKIQSKLKRHVSAETFWQAIQQVGVLGDEQLLSEMYAKYAELKAPKEKRLYYLLKAIQIQERIGIERFPNIYFRYLTLSGWLYRTTDYERSLAYSLKGLKSFDPVNSYLIDYIYLIDMIGASYKELKQGDSAIVYYQKLNGIIRNYRLNPNNYSKVRKPEERMLEIWEGIAKGGLGRALVIQKKYQEAYPLLQQNYSISLRHNEFGNAASALSVMAQANYQNHHYQLALSQYRQAYRYIFGLKESYNVKTKIEIADGLSHTFSKLHQYDSAYVYQQAHTLMRDSLQHMANLVHFAATSTEVEFEAIQHAFENAQTEVAGQKRLRNIVLAAVVVLTFIALILYNRNRLKHKLHQEKLETEKQLAQMEIAVAKTQLDAFIHNIFEKNKLIEELQKRFGGEINVGDISLHDISVLTDEEWNAFRVSFNKVYPNFFAKIKKAMPDISNAELRFLALSKLDMTTKEMAVAQGITIDAVRKQRHRLRKKLEGISVELSLEDFISSN